MLAIVVVRVPATTAVAVAIDCAAAALALVAVAVASVGGVRTTPDVSAQATIGVDWRDVVAALAVAEELSLAMASG